MLFKYTFKYVLIGDYNTGKSAIIDRFINNNFDIDNIYGTTIGAEYYTKIMNIENTNVKICLWDTSDHERFRAITESYIRDVTCVFIVFDLTDKKSFLNVPYWLNKVKYNNQNTIIILIGTKLDKFNNIKINKPEIDQFTQNNNLHYFETSSKNNINITELFLYSASLIIKKINSNIITESKFQYLGIKDTEPINKIEKIDNITVKNISCCTII